MGLVKHAIWRLAAVALLLVSAMGMPIGATAATDTVPDQRVVADLRAAVAKLDASGVRGAPQGGAVAPGLTQMIAERDSFTAAARSVCYNVHLENIGWQGVRCDGQVAGTTGQSRRMEAISITVSAEVGNVCYAVHLENRGWQPLVCNGAVAGTTGQSRRMEAIQIVVSVPSVCYNVHVQDRGWLPTACDGAIAGTIGQSKRMEAITIRV